VTTVRQSDWSRRDAESAHTNYEAERNDTVDGNNWNEAELDKDLKLDKRGGDRALE